jgi:hypothetical protein
LEKGRKPAPQGTDGNTANLNSSGQCSRCRNQK